MKEFLGFIRLRWYYCLIAGLIFVGVSIFIYFQVSKKADDVDMNSVANLINEDKKVDLVDFQDLETYSVDIKGAIKKPGVYKVVKNSRVNDVIEIAGGLTKNAYTDNINLSKKINDEMVIYVYTKNQYKNKSMLETKEPCLCSQKDAQITACLENGNSLIEQDKYSEKDDKDEENNNVKSEGSNDLININKATKSEFMTLPGIGESKAESILKYREAYGNFKSIEEIKNVSGIGDALFEQIQALIIV